MKKLFLILACGLFMANVSMAQAPKFGYIDSRELLKSMPEVVKADTALSLYAKSFQEQLESMGKEYQTKIQQYQSQEKTMTDAVKEVRQKELMDLQNRIEGMQQSAQDKVAQKKQDLYSPILEKADKAIKDVAKEKAYDYVFDAGQGALLFAKDSDNILALVKAKLGIK